MGFPVGRLSLAGSGRSQQVFSQKKLQIQYVYKCGWAYMQPDTHRAPPRGGAGCMRRRRHDRWCRNISHQAAAALSTLPVPVGASGLLCSTPIVALSHARRGQRPRRGRAFRVAGVDSITFTAPGCAAGRMNEWRAGDPHPFIMQPTDGCTLALVPPLMLSARVWTHCFVSHFHATCRLCTIQPGLPLRMPQTKFTHCDGDKTKLLIIMFKKKKITSRSVIKVG